MDYQDATALMRTEYRQWVSIFHAYGCDVPFNQDTPPQWWLCHLASWAADNLSTGLLRDSPFVS